MPTRPSCSRPSPRNICFPRLEPHSRLRSPSTREAASADPANPTREIAPLVWLDEVERSWGDEPVDLDRQPTSVAGDAVSDDAVVPRAVLDVRDESDLRHPRRLRHCGERKKVSL
jgi:hypothetical protein